MQVDMLFVNLRMESLYLKENFNINWFAETGLIDNIAQVVMEYKQARGLLVMLWYRILNCSSLFIPNRNGYINTSLKLIK